MITLNKQELDARIETARILASNACYEGKPGTAGLSEGLRRLMHDVVDDQAIQMSQAYRLAWSTTFDLTHPSR